MLCVEELCAVIEIAYEIEEELNPPQTRILQPEDGEIIADFSNQPFASVELWGYGLGPDGFLPDSALTWEYRQVGTNSAWSLAGAEESLTIQLQDYYCNSATEYEIRLTADDGTLPPGYAYVRIGVRAIIC